MKRADRVLAHHLGFTRAERTQAQQNRAERERKAAAEEAALAEGLAGVKL